MKIIAFIAFAFVETLISGCAGSTYWATHATDKDLHAASDFDLCHGFQNYKINPGIESEILRRNLLTKSDWDNLIDTEKVGVRFSVGDKKCAVFAHGWGSYWIRESTQETAGHSEEVWKNPACEPTLFMLLGRACDSIDFTFEDNVVSVIQCNGSDAFCKSMGYPKAN